MVERRRGRLAADAVDAARHANCFPDKLSAFLSPSSPMMTGHRRRRRHEREDELRLDGGGGVGVGEGGGVGHELNKVQIKFAIVLIVRRSPTW